MDRYADIITEISHSAVDRSFEYRIPEELSGDVHIGSKVNVPFGKGNKIISGYVIDIKNTPDYDPGKIKAIESVDKGSFNPEINRLKIAYFIKQNYGSTMINAIKIVLPVKKITGRITKKKIVSLGTESQIKEAYEKAISKRQVGKARLLKELTECETIDYSLVTGKLSVSPNTIKSVEKSGLIRIEEVNSKETELKFRSNDALWPELSDEQKNVVKTINEDVEKGINSKHLILGITGSGKTEVYINIIKKCLDEGKQAILLVPEIALSYQNVARFYRRFGDKVAVMHSKLTQGERCEAFLRAKSGEISVMIGPRSALFTPFDNLGVIIIDEEHESSYKSENMPKYHAREVAAYMASLYNCPLVMGSATPSVDTYMKALDGDVKLHKLTVRLTGENLPNCEIIDLRKELEEGNKSIFSRRLKKLLGECLERGEQAMLFINRRGYAGFVSCRECGHVFKCPHCDVSLSRHGNNKLVCHYCGHEEDMPKICPECKSDKVYAFRAGTEKIEEAVKKEFPGAITLRMDADTAKKNEDYEGILSRFANGDADVLVGTQMIVKGHDFKGVTLVGVLAADMSLYSGDYRCAERTFDLITQAAGRAGRGDKPGNVVIQTYQPEHYAIIHASNQDYEGFYNEESIYRKIAKYPPFCHMLEVQLLGPKEEDIQELALKLMEQAEKVTGDKNIIRIGPGKASIGKINDMYRMVIYYKSEDYSYLVKIKDIMEKYKLLYGPTRDMVWFDFNPISSF